MLLEELSDKHGVFIMVVVQATYTFDVNSCDAFSKTEIANLPCPIVYRLHSLRLETGVWWNLSYTDDTAVLHASALAKYGGGYRREFDSTIYLGLVRWNRWWTRHRIRKRVWLCLESENFHHETFEKQEIEYNFDMYSLKTFLPKFCQGLPVIWVKWSYRFEIQLWPVSQNLKEFLPRQNNWEVSKLISNL